MSAKLRSASLPVRCFLAAISGLLYALAFPPLGWRLLIVPGIAGLLLSLQGLRGSRARGIGFLHGMMTYTVGVPWLWLIFGPFAAALWMLLAAFSAAFAWMQSRAEARGMAGWRMVLFTVVNWCGWEFIRAELFPLKFPWMTAGLAMGPNYELPLIGVYGASAWVLLLCAALFWSPWRALPLGVVVLWPLTVTEVRQMPLPKGAPGSVRVGGLQYENESFKHYLDVSKSLPADVQHVVWPEYALPYDVRANRVDWAELQAYCRERKVTLTLGTQTTRREPPPGWQNTALTLDASGVLGEHYKVHIVHFFDDGVPGTTAIPVATDHGKVGTPVCFDCDNEGVTRRMTAAGAEAFIVPMMDAESWSKRQHDQHVELFRIRACENGRWFFVCATSGVSQIIDPLGHVHARLSAMEQGVLTGELPREMRMTFYTRWGWLTPWFLLATAAVCWIALLLPRRTAKDFTS